MGESRKPRPNRLADRIAAAGTPPEERQPGPAPARETRTKAVRITVDLDPLDHRRMQELRRRLEETTGLASVPAAEIVRVLLEELAVNGNLLESVRLRILERDRARRT